MTSEKIIVGSISDQQQSMRGWLVGQFFPEESTFHDKQVEVYCKVLKKSEFTDKLHYHPEGKEYLFVLDGYVEIQVGPQLVRLEKGEYVAIDHGVNDKIVSFSDEATIFGVRHPSIPNNKVLLEE